MLSRNVGDKVWRINMSLSIFLIAFIHFGLIHLNLFFTQFVKSILSLLSVRLFFVLP